jgi:hypothetical protein
MLFLRKALWSLSFQYDTGVTEINMLTFVPNLTVSDW